MAALDDAISAMEAALAVGVSTVTRIRYPDGTEREFTSSAELVDALKKLYALRDERPAGGTVRYGPIVTTRRA